MPEQHGRENQDGPMPQVPRVRPRPDPLRRRHPEQRLGTPPPTRRHARTDDRDSPQNRNNSSRPRVGRRTIEAHRRERDQPDTKPGQRNRHPSIQPPNERQRNRHQRPRSQLPRTRVDRVVRPRRRQRRLHDGGQKRSRARRGTGPRRSTPTAADARRPARRRRGLGRRRAFFSAASDRVPTRPATREPATTARQRRTAPPPTTTNNAAAETEEDCHRNNSHHAQRNGYSPRTPPPNAHR